MCQRTALSAQAPPAYISQNSANVPSPHPLRLQGRGDSGGPLQRAPEPLTWEPFQAVASVLPPPFLLPPRVGRHLRE